MQTPTPSANPVLWDLAKIVIPSLLAWLAATWRAKKVAEKRVESFDVEKAVSDATKRVEADITKALGALGDRMTKVEFVLWGVDGTGGLRADSARMAKRLEEDHELLLNVSLMVRDLYRRLLNAEPPAPPSIS